VRGFICNRLGAACTVQALRFERDSASPSSSTTYDHNKQRALSSKAWEGFKKHQGLMTVGKGLIGGYQSPVLTTMEQVEIVISLRESSIPHSFRLKHMQVIRGMLPGSSLPSPLPPYLSCLANVVRVGEHTYQAKAPDWQRWMQFASSYEKSEGVHLNKASRHQAGGRHSLDQLPMFFFGGKPIWDAREGRKGKVPSDFARPKSAGSSHKCSCPAHITAFISLPYAYSLGICSREGGRGSEGEARDINTSVRLELHLSHEGHSPNSVSDLFRLPLDPRVAQYTREKSQAGVRGDAL
jgi:hypothetical protein